MHLQDTPSDCMYTKTLDQARAVLLCQLRRKPVGISNLTRQPQLPAGPPLHGAQPQENTHYWTSLLQIIRLKHNSVRSATVSALTRALSAPDLSFPVTVKWPVRTTAATRLRESKNEVLLTTEREVLAETTMPRKTQTKRRRDMGNFKPFVSEQTWSLGGHLACLARKGGGSLSHTHT